MSKARHPLSPLHPQWILRHSVSCLSMKCVTPMCVTHSTRHTYGVSLDRSSKDTTHLVVKSIAGAVEIHMHNNICKKMHKDHAYDTPSCRIPLFFFVSPCSRIRYVTTHHIVLIIVHTTHHVVKSIAGAVDFQFEGEFYTNLW